MNASSFVHGVDAGAELPNRSQQALRVGLWEARRIAMGLRLHGQVLVERQAGHVFHSEEPQWAFRDQLVERHQIRVLDIGKGAKLAFESVEVGAAGQVQGLERDLGLELFVVDQVDTTHTPGAKETNGAKSRRACEEHGSRSMVQLKPAPLWTHVSPIAMRRSLPRPPRARPVMAPSWRGVAGKQVRASPSSQSSLAPAVIQLTMAAISPDVSFAVWYGIGLFRFDGSGAPATFW